MVSPQSSVKNSTVLLKNQIPRDRNQDWDWEEVTHPFLWRPSDPEEEDHQRSGQKLPDEQNDPEHDVPGVPEGRPQIGLEDWGQVRGLSGFKDRKPRAHV